MRPGGTSCGLWPCPTLSHSFRIFTWEKRPAGATADGFASPPAGERSACWMALPLVRAAAGRRAGIAGRALAAAARAGAAGLTAHIAARARLGSGHPAHVVLGLPFQALLEAL